MKHRNGRTGSIAVLALVGSVSACSSTGDTEDTGELLLEGAQACSTVCKRHPDVDAFSYRAGGGAPLLFLGSIEASCRCAAEPRDAASPVSGLQDGSRDDLRDGRS